MDGTDPATWDPALDGALAAPENHTVLYEDEAIRVIRRVSLQAPSKSRTTIVCPLSSSSIGW